MFINSAILEWNYRNVVETNTIILKKTKGHNSNTDKMHRLICLHHLCKVLLKSKGTLKYSIPFNLGVFIYSQNRYLSPHKYC